MKRKSVTIFFLIDALGWEWIKHGSFLDERAELKQRVRTVFGFSSAAIPSILTGKYPDEHGRWNLLYYSPETSPFRWTRPLRLLPRFMRENRVSRKLINMVTKRLVGADGYFAGYVETDKLSLFDICEKRNIYRPGGIEGSTTIIDAMEARSISYRAYSYHDHTDSGIFDALGNDLRAGKHDLYFAYLPELDAYLHAHSDVPDLVATKLAWYEKKVSQVLDTAEDHVESVRWFVFSDHGMTLVTAHYDLIGDLRNAGITIGKDCLAVFDSTMARFWVDGQAVRERICRVLERCPAGRILTETDLKKLRVYFHDQRYGQIIFLMEPGTLIFPNIFGSHKPSGMHGFHPDDKHSYGVFLSNIKGYDPRVIVDFHNVMNAELEKYSK